MRTRRSLTAALALTLTLGAMGTPVAVGGSHAGGTRRPDPGAQVSPRAGTRIVRVTDRSGFDWAAAGIGAAGGLALSILGVGVVLLVAERRGGARPST